MRLFSRVRSLVLAGVAIGLFSAGGASAQTFGAPYAGGFGAVTYDEGYYGGGAIQALTGFYGGGNYRRAAYSAADVYVNAGPAYAPAPPHVAYGGSYERSYVVPQTSYRPYVRTHYVPVTTYRAVQTMHYQPVTTYRVVRKRCHCELEY